MNNLDKARLIINEVDEKIANSFEERMKASSEVAEYKKQAILAIEEILKITGRSRDFVEKTLAK